jgi:hypothetical protein
VTSLIYFYYEQAKSLNIPRKQTASEQPLFNLSSAVVIEGSNVNSINADDKFIPADSSDSENSAFEMINVRPNER